MIVDLTKAIAAQGQRITQLPQIFFAEFNEAKYHYTFAQVTNSTSFQQQRLRRYRSPYVLDAQVLPDKFESVLAIDVAMAVLRTFSDSQ
jgi:hypothetical protein